MWVDAHLDLAYLAVNGRDLRAPLRDPEAGCVNLPALRAAGIGLAFGTIFTAPGADGPEGYPAADVDAARRAGRLQLREYDLLAEAAAIRLVRSRLDLEEDRPSPGIVVLMEGADPIRDAEDVAAWHEAGLRLVGLAWALGTRYAGGNQTGGGLTPAGRDLVAALDAQGIAHDASHLSDQAFDELLAATEGPVVATHSNCRALMGGRNERHLRDEQIRAIAKRGGIVGLNLYGTFLAEGRRATVDDCVRHVEHVVSVMGHAQGVGLGSDMDGGFGPAQLPEHLDAPERLGRLVHALRRAGWGEEDVEAFRRGNWRRWLEGVLPAE